MVEGEWIKVRNKHQDLGKSHLDRIAQHLVSEDVLVRLRCVKDLRLNRHSGGSGI
jgi:hypothetical protein